MIVEEWMETVAGLHPDCLVWLLYLAESPGLVTARATSDYSSHRSKVERFAAEMGVEDFNAKNGYDCLSRAPVTFKQKNGEIINDDKSDRLLRLTSPVGRGVILRLSSDPEFQRFVKNRLGVLQEEGSWFPFEMPDKPKIRMTGKNPEKDSDGFTHFTVTSTLNCTQCGDVFTHEYKAVWPKEKVAIVEATCKHCGYTNTHHKVNPGSAPW